MSLTNAGGSGARSAGGVGISGHERASSTSSVQGNSYGQQSHSRRAPSASSIASSGTAYSSARGSYAGSASGTAGGSSSTAHLESTVTKLLVSTKQLLEGLTEWSQGKISEEQVSDIYVRLGNCFNSAVAAFTREGISMRDLKEVPQLLRIRLEAAINEEASAATLHEHLPKIRPIILDLLRGLREKQDQHQAMLAAQTRAANENERSASVSQANYQYSQASGSSRRQDSLSNHSASAREDGSLSAREHGPANGRISPNSQAIAGQSTSRPSSRTGQHVGSSESDPSSISRQPSTDSSGLGVGARRPSNNPRPSSLVKSRSASSLRQPNSTGSTSSSLPPEAPLPPLPTPASVQPSVYSVQSTAPNGSRPLPLPGARLLQIPDGAAVATPPVPRMGPVPFNVDLSTTPPSIQQAPPGPSAFSTPPRSTLRPMPAASTSIPSQPAASHPVPDEISLEALKKADPLARRASKRFSAYTFSKISSSNLTGSTSSPGGLGMTGLGLSTPGRNPAIERDDSSAREYMTQSGSGTVDKGQRKAKKAKSPRTDMHEPPVPALPPLQNLPTLSFSPEDGKVASDMQTPRKKRVSVVAEETEDQLDADEKGADAASNSSQANLTPQAAEKQSGFMPRSGSSTSIASTASAYSNVLNSSSQQQPGTTQPVSEPQTPRPPKTVFLQLGRDMKKAKLDAESWPTFAALRTLFTDKFAYNPGLADFPPIYLRDSASGVQYELEDVEEVRENSVLSLNIEPLDQVKQHIDEGLATLSRELKELKSAMNSSKRASVALIAAQNPGQQPQGVLSPPSARQPPSDLQLHTAAQDVLQMKRKLSATAGAQAAIGTGRAEDSAADRSVPSTPVTEARVQKLAAELKSSIQEVRNARREIGVLRQMYTDFRTETSTIISTLRAQTEKVKDIANSKVAGSRAFIDTGKAKLDTRSQDLLTKIEDLQDSIDDLKNDVTVKRMRPRPKQLDSVQSTISSSQAELDDLSKYIATVKPMWKKTWETELQNIVEEQHLLNYQEELLGDLKTDHENVVALFTQIKEYVSLQSNSKGRKPSYRPPSPDTNHEGLSTVLLEVKGRPQASDKRMKAIEMAEKARQKEAADRTDEFAAELGGFVDGRKLKKTGGAEEAERIRQMKSEASLKAMFQQPTAPPAPVASVKPPPLPADPVAAPKDTPTVADEQSKKMVESETGTDKASLASDVNGLAGGTAAESEGPAD